MSEAQRNHEIEGIQRAGWAQHATGFWVHPAVGGLHNLASAIAMTARWAD